MVKVNPRVKRREVDITSYTSNTSTVLLVLSNKSRCPSASQMLHVPSLTLVCSTLYARVEILCNFDIADDAITFAKYLGRKNGSEVSFGLLEYGVSFELSLPSVLSLVMSNLLVVNLKSVSEVWNKINEFFTRWFSLF